MGERITFVSWNYLRLICVLHKTELELRSKGNKTLYTCTDEFCSVALPTELYEKLLEEVVDMQNKGPLMVGHRWRIKGKNDAFEFAIVSSANGKAPTVSVMKL